MGACDNRRRRKAPQGRVVGVRSGADDGHLLTLPQIPRGAHFLSLQLQDSPNSHVRDWAAKRLSLWLALRSFDNHLAAARAWTRKPKRLPQGLIGLMEKTSEHHQNIKRCNPWNTNGYPTCITKKKLEKKLVKIFAKILPKRELFFCRKSQRRTADGGDFRPKISMDSSNNILQKWWVKLLRIAPK